MERWDDVRFFLAAARAGSLAQAAARLGVESSTVSRRVRALEEAVGGALFQRTSEGLLLTPLGEALVPHAERSEQGMLGMQRAATSQREQAPRGTVRLAMTDGLAMYWFVPRLDALLTRHPELQIELVTGQSLVDLTRREADLAVRFIRPERGELVATRLARLRLAPLVHARLASAPAHTLRWIGLGGGSVERMEAQWMREHLDAPERAHPLRVNDYPVQVEATRHGLGVALLPRSLTEQFDELVVREDLVDPDVLPELEVWLVAHEAMRQVPRVRAVWAFLSEEARALRGG